ncbi:hypothetical protein [Catenulispora rubra]|uniref:hypothetical protein n=1 Tax=Catenulispora rubra TaxID=280293 RepID=UPI001892386E|nr:hypothetical protein [Catenulispora rubra]
MQLAKLCISTASVAGLAVAGALALAPAANAVTPASATVSFNCGFFGSGSATITAAQAGTTATFTLTTSAITSPISIGANSVTSTLTMTANGGGTETFTGSSNPAITAGQPISTGPLTGTVNAGDSLEGHSLNVVVFGISVTCTATSAQSPGPFQF